LLDAPVTVTTAHQVAPGREAEFQAWANSMLQEAGKSRNYLGGGVISPGDGGGEWHVVYRWSDRDAALRWEGAASDDTPAPAGDRTRSADRAARAARFLESAGARAADAAQAGSERPSQVRSPPPKWKLALVTLAAVFPPVMLFNVTVIPYLRGVSVVVRTMALCVAVTAIVTWVMMPNLQRLLKGWLNPAAAAKGARAARGRRTAARRQPAAVAGSFEQTVFPQQTPLDVAPEAARQEAYAEAYPQESYPQEPYQQDAYPQQTAQEVFPQNAYAQTGYPQQGYPQQGYPQDGYDQQVFPQGGYEQPAYPQPAAYAQQAQAQQQTYTRETYTQEIYAQQTYQPPAYPQQPATPPQAFPQPAPQPVQQPPAEPAYPSENYAQQAYAQRIEAQRAQAQQVYAQRAQAALPGSYDPQLYAQLYPQEVYGTPTYAQEDDDGQPEARPAYPQREPTYRQRQGSPVSRRLPVSGSAPAPETGETPAAAGSGGRHRR